MNTINDRIQLIADMLFAGNVTAMSDMMSIKKSTLYSIVGRQKVTPGFDVISKIASMSQHRISMEWLIRGNGDMLETSASQSVVAVTSEGAGNQVSNESQNSGRNNETRGNISTQNIYNGDVKHSEAAIKTLTDTIALLTKELETSQQQKSRLIEIVDKQLTQNQQLIDLLNR